MSDWNDRRAKATERFRLFDSEIDEIEDRVSRFLTEQKLEQHEVTRLRLTMRELLLRIAEHYGQNKECTVRMDRRFGSAGILVTYTGNAYNPTALGRDSLGDQWSVRLLTTIGLVPEWSYRGTVNRLVLRPQKKTSVTAFVLAAVLAVLLGLTGSVLPEPFLSFAVSAVLTPLFDTFLGLLGCFSGLMVFFSVISGICGIGDTSTLGRVGRVILLLFIGQTCLWCAVGCIAGIFLFHPDFSAALQLPQLLGGLIPRDPVSPFRDGCGGQILFLSGFIGAMLLFSGGRTERVRELAEQFDLIFLAAMEHLCKLMPLFVFLTLLRQLWSGPSPSLLYLWKPLAVILTGSLLLVLLKLFLTALRLRLRPRRLLNLLLPSFLAALTAASTSSVFGQTMDNCEARLGVSHKLLLIALPIGNVLCLPAVSFCSSTLLLYLAERCGVPVSLSWLFLLMIVVSGLCFTVPSVPGALLACFGLVLRQLGLPPECYVVMAALNVFVDAVSAACCNAFVQLELAAQAELLDMLDRRVPGAE